MKEKVKGIMASVFNIAVSAINDDASPDTIDKWDSLGHMNLIVALEENFSVTFSDDEIPELLCLTDIVQKLNAKVSN